MVEVIKCRTFYLAVTCPHCNEEFFIDEFTDEGTFNETYMKIQHSVLGKNLPCTIECLKCGEDITIENVFDE